MENETYCDCYSHKVMLNHSIHKTQYQADLPLQLIINNFKIYLQL